jgi:fatty-acid desaturase
MCLFLLYLHPTENFYDEQAALPFVCVILGQNTTVIMHVVSSLLCNLANLCSFDRKELVCWATDWIIHLMATEGIAIMSFVHMLLRHRSHYIHSCLTYHYSLAGNTARNCGRWKIRR